MIIESHPDTYNGYPFITLVQFNERHLLTIIDNYDKKTIKAYVLDFCEVVQIDELSLIEVANNWFGEGHPTYPISIEFSKLGLTAEVSKIYRSYAIDSVSRIIGPMSSFDMDHIHKVKRKRRVIPSDVIRTQLTEGNL
jgi:hypothetical protein